MIRIPCLLILLLAAAAPAAAQEAAHVADLSPLAATLADLAGAALAALAAVLAGAMVRLVHRWTGVVVEEQHRRVLQDALERAVDYGWSRVAAAAADAGRSVDLRSEVLAHAAEYVAARTPDALRHFGVSPESLRQLLEARLGAGGLDGPEREPQPGPEPAPATP